MKSDDALVLRFFLAGAGAGSFAALSSPFFLFRFVRSPPLRSAFAPPAASGRSTYLPTFFALVFRATRSGKNLTQATSPARL